MRKILIVPVGKVDNFLTMAKENNIQEIIEGIPPSLCNLYNEEELPIIHEEEFQLSELSGIERLQRENETLQMSVMELSTYSAIQDERLKGQEQAILELSMLVAGGGA